MRWCWVFVQSHHGEPAAAPAFGTRICYLVVSSRCVYFTVPMESKTPEVKRRATHCCNYTCAVSEHYLWVVWEPCLCWVSGDTLPNSHQLAEGMDLVLPNSLRCSFLLVLGK